MKVDWKMLSMIARHWPTGRARDFPETLYRIYQARIGRPDRGKWNPGKRKWERV